MYDKSGSGRLAPSWGGRDGDGVMDGPDCECRPGECRDDCYYQGCRGWVRDASESSGLTFEYDPDACPQAGKPIVLTVTVTVDPDSGSGPFTRADVVAALEARLSEFYPTDDAYPVVPTLEIAP